MEPLFSLCLCRQAPIGFVAQELIKLFLQIIGFGIIGSSKSLPHSEAISPGIRVDHIGCRKITAHALRPCDRLRVATYRFSMTSVVQLLFRCAS